MTKLDKLPMKPWEAYSDVEFDKLVNDSVEYAKAGYVTTSIFGDDIKKALLSD